MSDTSFNRQHKSKKHPPIHSIQKSHQPCFPAARGIGLAGEDVAAFDAQLHQRAGGSDAPAAVRGENQPGSSGPGSCVVQVVSFWRPIVIVISYELFKYV